MKTFLLQGNKQGRLIAQDGEKLRDYIAENPGRYRIERDLPESKDQRGFFEGAVCALVTYFQEDKDHHNWKDIKDVREWLKVEFNGEMACIAGKCHVIGESTKGKLNDGFLESVTDWLEEQYGIDRNEVLNPKKYKYWQDVIFSEGGPDNYIDYLVSIKKL